MDLEKHSYTPLSGPEEIRLLGLLPGRSDQVVSCTLSSYQMSEPKQRRSYEAISYEWGAPGQYAFIELNGRQHCIQANLYAFLKVLRSSNEVRVLWADAVCINQSDIPERNQQVRIMRKIFRQADRVLSWLGPAADGSDVAFDFCNAMQEGPLLNSEAMEREWRSSERNLVDVRYNALVALQKRGYWNRLWIVPEVTLAKEVILHCGDRRMSFDAIRRARDILRSNVRHESLRRDIPDPNGFYQLFSYRTSESTYPLHKLLQRFGTFQCGEIHDRVYALLDTDTYTEFRRNRTSIVDYSCPVEELFYDVLLYCAPTDPLKHPVNFCSELLKILSLSPQHCLSWLRNRRYTNGALFKELSTLVCQEKLRDVLTLACREEVIDQRCREQGISKFKIDEKPRRLWTTSAALEGDITYEHFGRSVALYRRTSIPNPQIQSKGLSIDSLKPGYEFVGIGIKGTFEDSSTIKGLCDYFEDPLMASCFADFKDRQLRDDEGFWAGIDVRLSCLDLVFLSF